MELRRISPFREGHWDKGWTRWDKMGAGIMAQPKPRPALPNDDGLFLDVSVRLRDDGLLYNSATDEFFQADSELFDLLKAFEDPMKLQGLLKDPDARVRDGISIANEAGLLVGQQSDTMI